MGRGQWSLTGLRTSLRAGPTGARHGTAADDVDAPRTRWRVSSPAARQHEQSPPNAGVNDFEFAICEGPSALPSLDPMILQQWQTQQLLRMSQRTVHMHSMIEMLQEQNRTLNAEKSNTLKISHPNMDMRELEQKKEMRTKARTTRPARPFGGTLVKRVRFAAGRACRRVFCAGAPRVIWTAGHRADCPTGGPFWAPGSSCTRSGRPSSTAP